MSLRKRLAASAVVIAALATASPLATAGAATVPAGSTAINTNDWLYATCPAWYGFKNPAVGCSSWADYFRYAVPGGRF
jgi:hypothetical protein